jgi:hypothetical protein
LSIEHCPDDVLLLLCSSGDVYEGQYQDEEKHGTGKYTSANGDAYEGTFVHGKKSGKGVFTYSSGNVYSGDYKDGKQNGQVLSYMHACFLFEFHCFVHIL